MTTTALTIAVWTIICTVVAAFIARKPLTTVIRVSVHGEKFAGIDFIIKERRDDYIVLARRNGADAIQMKLTDEGVEIDRDDSMMIDIAERTKDKNWVRK